MTAKKVIVLRHMKERRDDTVAKFLDKYGSHQTHVNPALDVPLPSDFKKYDALVIYGGIQSANDGPPDKSYIAEELDWIADWIAAGQPTLGICLGAQLIAKCLGATVAPHPENVCEIGYRRIVPAKPANGFLNAPLHFYQWHREGFSLPDNCELLAKGDVFPNQAFRYGSNVYGVQFHPEVTQSVMRDWTIKGNLMLSNPGAHSADRQYQDAGRFANTMSEWCRNFLEDWSQAW